MSREIALSERIYPRDCLQKTMLAYRDVCRVSLRDVSTPQYVMWIESCSPDVDEDVAIHEFLNYLLDLSLEHYFSEQQENL